MATKTKTRKQQPEPVRSCERCGCTDGRACRGGCSWIAEDVNICSACATPGEMFRAQVMESAKAHTYTSVDDLKSSLPHENMIAILMAAESLCTKHGYKTKVEIIQRRLRQLCAAERTELTIRFTDGGQDFHEWDVDAIGQVIDSRPFQAWTWCGCIVLNVPELKPGRLVLIRSHHDGDDLKVRYPIESVTKRGLPATGTVKVAAVRKGARR